MRIPGVFHPLLCLVCVILVNVRSYLPQTVRHARILRPLSLSRLDLLAQEVVVSGNSTATLLKLIALGDLWRNDRTDDIGFGTALRLPDSWERVTGCMADARVHATIAPDSVVLDGVADSRVANGMLALLCKGLTGCRVDEVLALQPSSIARNLGLQCLPPGRLNGLQNMVLAIQRQVRACEEAASNPGPTQTRTTNLPKKAEDGATFLASQASKFMGPSLGEIDPRAQEVAVLLSGGVDSSVALHLLQSQGHRVRAFYLKIWLEDEVAHLNECPWEEDLTYASQTCRQLGVPLETLSLQKEYWQHVVQYTFAEARAGRTPNPDIMCNSRVKVSFQVLMCCYHACIFTYTHSC